MSATRPTDAPRYSQRPFPPYRHVPGETPHPRRDPGGYSHGRSEPSVPPWDPAGWRELDLWLHAVDLFNHGYWWEAHEALEALWHAAGRTTPEARFVQGLVLVAAGYLNRARGKRTATRQVERGLRRMEAVAPGVYLGLDVPSFARAVRDDLADQGPPASIRLAGARAPR
jgi:predicted metal-dependent hydrolase